MTLQKLSLIGALVIGTLLIVANMMMGNSAYISGPGFNSECKTGSTAVKDGVTITVTGIETHTVQGKSVSMCCSEATEHDLIYGEVTVKYCTGKKDGKLCKIGLDSKGSVIKEVCE